MQCETIDDEDMRFVASLLVDTKVPDTVKKEFRLMRTRESAKKSRERVRETINVLKKSNFALEQENVRLQHLLYNCWIKLYGNDVCPPVNVKLPIPRVPS